jgi:hypothetical protein
MEKLKDVRLKALSFFGIGCALLKYSSIPGVLNPPSIFALGILFLLVAAAFFVKTYVDWKWLYNTVVFIETLPIWPLGLFLPSYGISIWLIQEHCVIAGIFAATITYCVFIDAIEKLFKRSVLVPAFNKFNIFQPSTKIPKDL